MEKKVFFAENGEQGLTSTSANHVANLAKALYESAETQLKEISFVNTDINLISAPEQKSRTAGGVDAETVQSLSKMLHRIADLKSLIAWLREAIKAKEDMMNELNKLNIYDYFERQGIQLPKIPEPGHTLTEEEYYDSLDIKERNKYYRLETLCAVLDKFIHPDGKYAEQKALLKKRMVAPNGFTGEGSNTIIYTYTPSVDYELVDKTYFELQAEHRSYQAQLNGIKNACQEAIHASKVEQNAIYREAYDKYSNEFQKYCTQFKEYQLKEGNRIKGLKIAVPNDLKEIYEEVSSQGK